MAAPKSKAGGASGGGNKRKGLKVAAAGPRQSSKTSSKRERGLFVKDLRNIMYGFGDDSDPLPETVLLVEDILVDYVTDMMHKAQEVASTRGELTPEDIIFLVRKDPPKVARAHELLAMHEELKRGRNSECTLEKMFPQEMVNALGKLGTGYGHGKPTRKGCQGT